MALINNIIGNPVGSIVGNVLPSEGLFLSQIFGEGDDGYAFDFTRTANATETTLYQDSSFTTPVTASNDLVGGVRDESGNNNDFTQTTAAAKVEWIENEGIQAIDVGDVLLGMAGIVDSDFTFIVYGEDMGTDLGYFLLLNTNGNNRALVLNAVTTGNATYQTIQSGVGVTSTIKASPTTGTVNTIVAKYDSSEANEMWSQFNNETPVEGNRTGAVSWGADKHYLASQYTAPIRRVIYIDRALSLGEIHTAKNMVRHGWAG